MKKLLTIVAALFLTALVFTSCKKDYTCACTYNYTGSAFFNDTSYAFNTTIKDTKKNADATCALANSSLSDGFGGTQTTTCNLK